jgi:hypothetical protein
LHHITVEYHENISLSTLKRVLKASYLSKTLEIFHSMLGKRNKVSTRYSTEYRGFHGCTTFNGWWTVTGM